MANTLLTTQMYTNELLMRLTNQLGFTNTIKHEFDDRFAQRSGKIGDTLNIRVPVKLTATKGTALSVQDVEERSVPLTLNTQAHADFSFSSKDMSLSIQDFGERYLKSAVVALGNTIDVDGLTLAYQSTYNTVGTPGTIPTDFETYLLAGAKLDDFGAPADDQRYVTVNPKMQVKIVNALKGLNQDAELLKKQYRRGRMTVAAGFDWGMDQNVRTHTVGPLGGTPLVNGASQTGASLVTDGWTAAAASRLKKGDTFTLAGVYSVNPVSGDSHSDLQSFVVKADVSSDGSGNATISIDPPIVTSGAYKTVSNSPADNAALTVLGAANTVTPQGLAYHRDAFAIACVPLERPRGVHNAAVATDPASKMSVRVVEAYDINTDKFVTRVDVLYGWAALRPEISCRIAS